MLKVIDAIDYATDHQCVVTDAIKLHFSKRLCFTVKKGSESIRVTQTDKNSRVWGIDGKTFNRARAIIHAVDILRGHS